MHLISDEQWGYSIVSGGRVLVSRHEGGRSLGGALEKNHLVQCTECHGSGFTAAPYVAGQPAGTGTGCNQINTVALALLEHIQTLV